MTDRRLLTTEQLAEILQVHPKTIGKHAKQGKSPPFVWVGGKKRFPSDQLEAWLKRNVQEKQV